MYADVIKAPAGLGKTRAFAQRVALSPFLTEIYVPTHLLGEDWRRHILSFNPAKKVVIIRGRDALLPCGRKLCAKSSMATQLTNAGVSVFPNLCRRGQGKGVPPIECSFYRHCDYIDQFSDADVYIYTHAHLGLRRGELEFWAPGEVIIDEAFFQNLVKETPLPIALLTDPRIPPPAAVLCRDLAAVLITGQGVFQRMQAALARSGDYAATLMALALKPALQPTMTSRQQAAALQGWTNFGPVRGLLEHLARCPTAHAARQSVVYDVATALLHVHTRLEITRFDRSDGTQPKIFILDASASRSIAKRFFPNSTFYETRVARNAHVVQCNSKKCSTTSLVPMKNGNQVSADRAAASLAEVDGLIVRLSAGGQKVLVVGPVAIVGNLKTGTPPLVSVPAHCELAHFNNLRGIDRWKDFDIVLIVGRNQPGVQTVEDLARQLFFDDPLPLALPGTWETEVRGYRCASNPVGVDVEVHADRRVQAVLEQLREEESVQAVDRLRLVHTKRPKTVVVLSNIPLDLHVDELRSWAEIMHGTRLEQAFDSTGKVLPLNPAWLTSRFSALWQTAAAAKKDVRRACKKGRFSNSISIRKMIPFEFEFKPLGQRRWSKCLAKVDKLVAVKVALGRLLGEPVVVRRPQRALAGVGSRPRGGTQRRQLS